MSGNPEQEARAALDAVGQLPDDEIDIGAAALQFARIDAPDADWRAAGGLLSDLARQAVEAATADARADAGDVEARRATLARLLHTDWGFAGDTATYDDPRNANLIHVLERRRGLPVALGILWLHVADAAGWAAHGVDFPGHFLVALGSARGPALLDVFGGGVALGAPELRGLIKAVEGPKAELRPGLVVPMTRRAVLLRLQNNIKLRRLRAGDLEAALTCTRDMLRIAPDHAALWREAGLMEQRLDRIGAALASLDRSLELEPEGEAASRIRGLVEELRNRLN
ncbi:SirB1 family protein [Roseococcus microcysteis]|uniref:SirB1 family protein n=1 Tax=Roseococcus microcysteis TaxID=2771361 RepID=UPI00168A408D|nr:tetratricopeptide repeat protein [Roseococcus microcysteis]